MARLACLAALRHPRVVWLALLIAVVGALAPALSHALARSGAGSPALVEVCTSSGARWVALAVSVAPADGQGTAPHIEHCPFCLHASDHCAPPTHPLAYHLRMRVGIHEAVVAQAYFYPTRHTIVPPPRGPPAAG